LKSNSIMLTLSLFKKTARRAAHKSSCSSCRRRNQRCCCCWWCCSNLAQLPHTIPAEPARKLLTGRMPPPPAPA
jgi:hypothetical protein